MPAHLPRRLLACLTLAPGALLPAGQGVAQGSPTFTCTRADWRDRLWQVFLGGGCGEGDVVCMRVAPSADRIVATVTANRG